MKKIVCITSAFLLFLFVANSQQTTFGLKAGLNASSVDIERAEDYETKLGVHLGALAHIHLSTHFAFQPELVFSTQGGKDDDDDDLKLKLNYVNIPLLLQYMTLDGFRFQTGPQIGVLASARYKNDGVEVDAEDDLESLDFSWVFGAGYLIPGANGLGVDVRYNLGLTNVSENETFEARNRVFQVGIFYQFMNRGGSRRR